MQSASGALIAALKDSLADEDAGWEATGIEETVVTAVKNVTSGASGELFEGFGTFTLTSTTQSETTERLRIALMAPLIPLAVGAPGVMRLAYTSVRLDDQFDHGEIDIDGLLLSSGDAGLDATMRAFARTGGAIAAAVGTPIGNMTDVGGLAAAFDGVRGQASTACATKGPPSATGYNNFIGKDWGAGNARTITRFKLFGPVDRNFFSGAGGLGWKLQGSTDNFASSIVTLASGTAPNVGAGEIVDIGEDTIDTSTAYRYHRLAFNGDGIYSIAVAELQFYEPEIASAFVADKDAAITAALVAGPQSAPLAPVALPGTLLATLKASLTDPDAGWKVTAFSGAAANEGRRLSLTLASGKVLADPAAGVTAAFSYEALLDLANGLVEATLAMDGGTWRTTDAALHADIMALAASFEAGKAAALNAAVGAGPGAPGDGDIPSELLAALKASLEGALWSVASATEMATEAPRGKLRITALVAGNAFVAPGSPIPAQFTWLSRRDSTDAFLSATVIMQGGQWRSVDADLDAVVSALTAAFLAARETQLVGGLNG